MVFEREKFGVCSNGDSAYLYTIKNDTGMTAKITDFGGIIVNLFVNDKQGQRKDVVIGFDTFAEYQVNPPYLGAAIGRCANRINNGKFSLDGTEYQLDCNEGTNHLHGGNIGFDKKLWKAEQTSQSCLKLTLFSPDKDQNYPGNLVVCVIYTITNDNVLEIVYRGFSDQKTIFNMTNHSYFNLDGQDSSSILEQYLSIDADAITSVDEDMSVTGDIMPIEGTPLDFRTSKKIGEHISAGHPQIRFVNGFDHNYVLNHNSNTIAQAYSEDSGICMDVYTDRPGIQLYTANYLNESLIVKGGRKAAAYMAFCLESQCFPDAINNPDFETPAIEAGECAEYKTSFAFSVK